MSGNKKDGGERCHHGFPVDMFEPELNEDSTFDNSLMRWIWQCVAIVFASSFVGLSAWIICDGWLR